MKKNRLISLIALIATMLLTFTFSACGKAKIIEINFDSTTVKTQYSFEETIDKSKVKLVVSYDDDTTTTLALTDEGVEIVSDFDTTSVGSKKFVAKYNDITIEHDYSVVAVYDSLSFVSGTYKLVYDYDETIDYSQIKIIASYNDGTSRTLSLTDEGVSKTAIDTKVVGKQTLSATYEGKTVDLEVEVKAVLVGIDLYGYLAEYGYEQENATENVFVLATYNDSTTKEFSLDELVVAGGEIISTVDTSVVGTYSILVKLGDYYAEVQGTVVSATVESIEVVESTLKSEYKIGSTDFNPNEIQIKVDEYGDGESYITLAQTSYSVKQTSQGQQTLQISYGGRATSVKLNFVAVLQEIEFKQATQTIYGYLQDVDYSKILFTLIYNDSAVNRELSLEDAENDGAVINKISNNTLGVQTLSISYLGKTAEIEVEVVRLVTGISLTQDAYEFKASNDEFDYSTIRLTISYNDTSSLEISLTDSAHSQYITYTDNIVLSVEALNINFAVSYIDYVTNNEYTTFANVNVRKEIDVVSVSLPEYYSAYLFNSNPANCSTTDATKFAAPNKPYLVGTVNGFKFEPQVWAVDFENVESYFVENPVTNYKLYLCENEDGTGNYTEVVDASEYISTTRDNIYWFKEDAQGKFFKLEAILDDSVYTDIPNSVTATFKVVYGYNVYDTYGLSVMDNLNVKNWAKIKNRQLPYDDKLLSEYTDVTEVILHKDIVVNADELPENYFWSENTPYYEAAVSNLAIDGKGAYEGLLLGSLRDGYGNKNIYYPCATDGSVNKYDLDGDGNIEEDEDFEETWGCTSVQKGIFNTDQCSVTGNYMKISVEEGTKVYTAKDGKTYTRKLYEVLSNKHNSGGNPTGHWSLFKFYKKTDVESQTYIVDIHYQDVYITGNMGKAGGQWGLTESHPDAVPAGLMATHMTPDSFVADNLVLNRFYVHFVVSQANTGSSILDFKNSHLTDAYSNMIFSWRGRTKITNSILKNAGGPIFVAVDGDRTTATAPTENDLNKVKASYEKYNFGVENADFDDCGPSIIVDELSELESHVTAQSAWFVENGAEGAIGMISLLNGLLYTNTQKSFMSNDGQNDVFNLIAVIIPETGSIFKANENINIFGKLSRKKANGEIETFQMNSNMLKLIKTMNSVGFTSNGQYAFMTGTTSLTVWPGSTYFDAWAKTQAGLSALPSASAYFGVSDIPASNFANASDWIGIAFRGDATSTKKCPYIMAVFGDLK